MTIKCIPYITFTVIFRILATSFFDICHDNIGWRILAFTAHLCLKSIDAFKKNKIKKIKKIARQDLQSMFSLGDWPRQHQRSFQLADHSCFVQICDRRWITQIYPHISKCFAVKMAWKPIWQRNLNHLYFSVKVIFHNHANKCIRGTYSDL